MKIVCEHCGKSAIKERNAVNRARREGMRLFCGRKCSGLARRKYKTKAQKVAEKRIYDAAYRKKNCARLKAEKRAYFKRTYDPAKASLARKARMPRHVEYCRRPEYRKWKAAYDKHRNATNIRARTNLPAWAPETLAQSIELFRQLRKELKREHKRA